MGRDRHRDEDRRRHHSSREEEEESPSRKRHHRRHHRHEKETSEEEEKDRHVSRKEKKRHRDDEKDDHRRRDKKKKKRRTRERSSEVDRKRRHTTKKDKKTKSKRDRHGHKPDKSLLYPMGDPLGHPPSTLLDTDRDYFTYHQPFWVYLYREEGTAFNDLTSEQAHKAFGRFASAYNRGRLEGPYYESSSFPPPVLEECKTTQHAWSFHTTKTERRGLEALQEGVRQQTEYKDAAAAAAGMAAKSSSTTQHAGMVAATSHNSGTTSAPGIDDRRHSTKPTSDRLEERRANRRLRDHVRNTEEELQGGSKDFRERQLAKKQAKADRQHGAHRDREEVTLSDAALYGDSSGGGGDRSSFSAALAREKQRRVQRQERGKTRVEEHQQKEEAKQQQMIQMLGLQGLKPGQKITIAPRKDG